MIRTDLTFEPYFFIREKLKYELKNELKYEIHNKTVIHKNIMLVLVLILISNSSD